MLQVIAIGGEPGTGKSSLVTALLEQAPLSEPLRKRLVRGCIIRPWRLVVLGLYYGGPFPGTDKLSMAVQPEAETFVRAMAEAPAYADWTILFEGDRLFNQSFLTRLDSMPVKLTVLILKAPKEELQRRYQERGSTQPEGFLKGRETKIERIRISRSCQIATNVTAADQTFILGSLLELLQVPSTGLLREAHT